MCKILLLRAEVILNTALKFNPVSICRYYIRVGFLFFRAFPALALHCLSFYRGEVSTLAIYTDKGQGHGSVEAEQVHSAVFFSSFFFFYPGAECWASLHRLEFPPYLRSITPDRDGFCVRLKRTNVFLQQRFTCSLRSSSLLRITRGSALMD